MHFMASVGPQQLLPLLRIYIYVLLNLYNYKNKNIWHGEASMSPPSLRMASSHICPVGQWLWGQRRSKGCFSHINFTSAPCFCKWFDIMSMSDVPPDNIGRGYPGHPSALFWSTPACNEWQSEIAAAAKDTFVHHLVRASFHILWKN